MTYEKLNKNESEEQTSLSISNNFQDIQNLRLLYNSAIKIMLTRLEIMNEEFTIKNSNSPIHHIESRLKSLQSIEKKLAKKGLEISLKSAIDNLNDIGGIRVVCPYIDDVYSVCEMILRQGDIKLIKKQDYIKEPNFNGYRSLHLDVQVPVFFSSKTKHVVIEIQIRTVAMDFFASLEHDLRYKSQKAISQEFIDDMRQKADEIARIDMSMQELHNKIKKL